jgi:hypothetical protein
MLNIFVWGMGVLNRTGDYVYDGKYIIPPIPIAHKSRDFLDEYGSTVKARPNQYVKEMFKKCHDILRN